MTPARTSIRSKRVASFVKAALAIILVVVIVSMTIFGKDDSTEDTKPRIPKGTVAGVEYIGGETLYCIDFEHTPEMGGDSAACDFERFYVEHPELLEQMRLKSDGETEN